MRSQPGPARGAAKGVPADGEIFIVDDDDDMRELLAAVLSLEGYPVKSFADG
jgi:FixJ family two-component response regulator